MPISALVVFRVYRGLLGMSLGAWGYKAGGKAEREAELLGATNEERRKTPPRACHLSLTVCPTSELFLPAGTSLERYNSLFCFGDTSHYTTFDHFRGC